MKKFTNMIRGTGTEHDPYIPGGGSDLSLTIFDLIEVKGLEVGKKLAFKWTDVLISVTREAANTFKAELKPSKSGSEMGYSNQKFILQQVQRTLMDYQKSKQPR